jgi:hypothetical protein
MQYSKRKYIYTGICIYSIYIIYRALQKDCVARPILVGEKPAAPHTTVGSLQRLLFFIPYIFFSILSVEKSAFSNFKATVARDCDAIQMECV